MLHWTVIFRSRIILGFPVLSFQWTLLLDFLGLIIVHLSPLYIWTCSLALELEFMLPHIILTKRLRETVSPPRTHLLLSPSSTNLSYREPIPSSWKSSSGAERLLVLHVSQITSSTDFVEQSTIVGNALDHLFAPLSWGQYIMPRWNNFFNDEQSERLEGI